MADAESSAREIARITKNTREEIVLALGTYKTYRLLHMRVWARGEAGEPIPTKSGFAVQAGLIPSLREALAQAEREARALGWLNDGGG
jgi:hypothetical protein